jgi:hypothetical protein
VVVDSIRLPEPPNMVLAVAADNNGAVYIARNRNLKYDRTSLSRGNIKCP